jgi:hypothetical protein
VGWRGRHRRRPRLGIGKAPPDRSIQNLADFIEDLMIPEDVKTRVREGRPKFNAYLDRPCQIAIEKTHPTNREILWAFVFGSLAHANQKEKAFCDSWAKHPLILGTMNQVFMAIMLEFLKLLGFLSANQALMRDRRHLSQAHTPFRPGSSRSFLFQSPPQSPIWLDESREIDPQANTRGGHNSSFPWPSRK